MSIEALGGSYVLTDEGVSQLAAMASCGSAPLSSAGFTSRLRESDSATTRLEVLEELLHHR